MSRRGVREVAAMRMTLCWWLMTAAHRWRRFDIGRHATMELQQMGAGLTQRHLPTTAVGAVTTAMPAAATTATATGAAAARTTMIRESICSLERDSLVNVVVSVSVNVDVNSSWSWSRRMMPIAVCWVLGCPRRELAMLLPRSRVSGKGNAPIIIYAVCL